VRWSGLFLSIAMAAAVFSGFLDLYVSRGAREYLQRQAEFELGLGPQPSMEIVMREARVAGFTAASLWGTGIMAGAWSMFALGRRRGTESSGPRPED
jgi:hypothetical protein